MRGCSFWRRGGRRDRRHATGAGATGFTAHEIGTGLARRLPGRSIADLNKDGKPDIIALAQRSARAALVRESRAGSGTCSPAACRRLINAAAYDIDGDGIPEIALAQGFTTSPKTSTGIMSDC